MSLSEQLQAILDSFPLFRVEMFLALGAISLLLLGLFTEKSILLRGFVFLIAGFALFFQFSIPVSSLNQSLFVNEIYVTPFSHSVSYLILFSTLLLLIFRENKKHTTEYYFILLAIGLGAMLMTKANSFLVTYLSIELVSLASYLITGFSFKKIGFEASIKYLIFGAISSVILLLGIAFLYGSTGVFYLNNLRLTNETINQLGAFFVLLGFFFKLGLFPMHLWIPATYQSAPSGAVAYISIIPKLAIIVLIHRFFQFVQHPVWLEFIAILLGIITILFGTLGAFRQKNTRRMISYGAIAQSGFLLPFALISSETSLSLFWWFAVVYLVMNFLAFYLIDCYEKKGIYQISEYTNIENGSKNILSYGFLIVALSLIGLPPLAGFLAKFFVFTLLWEQFSVHSNLWYLIYLLIAVLATVFSLFFYFKIPKNIFLPNQTAETKLVFRKEEQLIVIFLSFLLIIFFFFPELLSDLHKFLLNQNLLGL